MITETISTPIVRSCDVLVCGGGFGGISAALAAARHGKKVLLLEKEYMLGGLGTAGLVTIYLPLCDGMGRQVSFGIAEELFRLSISMGWEAKYPANWLDSDDVSKRTEKDPRFEVRYNAQLFAILAEQLLQKEGVEILYGTYAVATDCADGRINAVVVENKSGRQAIAVGNVVDATGDCDIAHFAKAPTETFKQGNVLAVLLCGSERLRSEDAGLLRHSGRSEDGSKPNAVSGRRTIHRPGRRGNFPLHAVVARFYAQ